MKVGIACFLTSFVWSALALGSLDFISGGTWLRTGDFGIIAWGFAVALGPQMLLAGIVALTPLSRAVKLAVAYGSLAGLLATLLARML